MALNNNLLASWNFDTVTGSDGAGQFQVLDVSNEYSGKGNSFTANSHEFVLKEDLHSGKKLHFETLEGSDTIQIVDNDDERISPLKKPSSVKLMVENSMYQVISDEMLNMFSTVDNYAFKFTLPNNKYKYEYDKLIELRSEFFQKVLDKPNLEKYIEFYKWIDSSLGSLIDQLKPENSSDFTGLKTTIESHILEREKYQHQLPVTIQPNRVYSNADKSIVVVKNTAGITGSSLTDNIENIVNLENIKNKNFNKNYEFIQTAGKFVNNRDNKPNKTVIETKFSAGDGLSELNRDTSDEFSVYNETNQRAKTLRSAYNTSQSHATGTQGSNTVPGPSTPSDFQDNAFIQRNIPYTASHYHETGTVYYQAFPNEEALFRQRNLILIDNPDTQYDVQEAAIEFAVPAKHTIRVNGAFEDMEINSPFAAKRDTFSPRVLQETGTVEKGFKAFFDRDFSKLGDETFFNQIKILDDSGSVQIKGYEVLENIYPRKDLMGRAEIRTKPDYQENKGTFNTGSNKWSDNSYNNNSAEIRSFWQDNEIDRRRTRGYENTGSGLGTGSINCLNQFNLKQDEKTVIFNSASSLYNWKYGSNYYFSASVINYNNSYNSIFALDANNSKISASIENGILKLNFGVGDSGTNISYGDLSVYGNNELIKFILSSDTYIPTAKPFFTYNYFIPFVGFNNIIYFFNNKSYSLNVDAKIIPFYNSYVDYFQNIKFYSQNHSIIPEFMVSNFNNIFNNVTQDPYASGSYLKILGTERFDKVDESIFIIDFNKFYDSKSNKIKIVFDGVKKLLPYKGFYPAERTSQIVNNFYVSYISGNISDSRQIQAAIQPFFAPGILFNTIKSGLAVDYPIFLTGSTDYLFTSSVYADIDSYKVIKEINFRVPFETILDPNKLFDKKDSLNNTYKMVYLDPDRYQGLFLQQQNSLNIKTPNIDFNLFSASSNAIYKYSINNFLSEIPNFFLKNKQLTCFVSKPESSFSFKPQTNYKLKIRISQNPNFSMFKQILNKTTQQTNPSKIIEKSLFGPPISSSVGGFDSYFVPNLPPFYNSFKSTDASKPNFNEIIISFTTDNRVEPYKVSDIFASASLIIPSDDLGDYAKNNAMFLNSCLNILQQQIDNKQINFNTITGEPLQNISISDYKWVIQTKMETPLIDFSDITTDLFESFSGSINLSSSSGIRNSTVTIVNANLEGIWSSYGSIPKDGQSIQISLDDTNIQNSLLKAVGFKKETKSIGVLADSKKISEAVVLLPFFKSISNISSDQYFYNKIEDLNLIKISRQTINTLLGVPDYAAIDAENNRRIDKIKTILNTNNNLNRTNSIIDMMIKMVNYNIPPHLNWLYDITLEPVVMFIAEFDHTLSKQDLANIWQNTMPEIAKTPELQSTKIEYFLNDNELMGNIDLTKSEIGMKVFKIKYRANGSYSDMLDDIEDNINYKYRKLDQSIPWYTYNWPYDYFSLVELVNVKAGEVYEAPVNQPQTTTVQLANAVTAVNAVSPLIGGNFANAVLAGLTGSR